MIDDEAIRLIERALDSIYSVKLTNIQWPFLDLNLLRKINPTWSAKLCYQLRNQQLSIQDL